MAFRTVCAAALVVALTSACGTSTPSGETATSSTVTTTAETAPPTSEPSVDEDLRAELLDMLAIDQALRGGPVPEGVDVSQLDFDAVDRSHQDRLREIFDEYGWPGWSLVGEDGSTAAWAIVQHADLDLEFQERGLGLLEEAVAAGDASAGDLAYLSDRVLVAKGEPQIYGTQWQLEGDEWVPRTPIDDEAHVDERRAEVGLNSIAEYLEELTG